MLSVISGIHNFLLLCVCVCVRTLTPICLVTSHLVSVWGRTKQTYISMASFS